MDINLNSSPASVGPGGGFIGDENYKMFNPLVTHGSSGEMNGSIITPGFSRKEHSSDLNSSQFCNGFQPQVQHPCQVPSPAFSTDKITTNNNPNAIQVLDGNTPHFESVQNSEDLDNLIFGDEYLCGLGSFRPKWSQCLANKQSFLTMFCLTSVLQGMYYTYFVSVLTTIEKLYQVQSKTTGIIMSATEIGQIGGALLLSYYGGQGDRPKWISGGMLIFAFASIICSAPHFLFGGQSLLSNHPSDSLSTSFRSDFSQSLCYEHNSSFPSLSDLPSEDFQPHHPSVIYSKCQDQDLKTAQSKVTNWVLGIFFASLFLIGIGTTAVNTLGIPYIDDNVAPRESPLYFGITIGVRIFGPVLGFLLGSICTSIYVDFPFGKQILSYSYS